MSHMVISQTWLLAGQEHLDSYLELLERFDGFLRAQPGFVSRRMVRSLEDPTHLTHLREFDDVSSYDAMTTIPEYQAQIAELSKLVNPAAYPDGHLVREYGEIVFDTPPPSSKNT